MYLLFAADPATGRSEPNWSARERRRTPCRVRPRANEAPASAGRGGQTSPPTRQHRQRIPRAPRQLIRTPRVAPTGVPPILGDPDPLGPAAATAATGGPPRLATALDAVHPCSALTAPGVDDTGPGRSHPAVTGA